MNQRNNCFSFFKGIACIFVVSLHIKFPIERIDNIIQCIARFAVPLFFMISGYFCYYDKYETYLEKLPNKIKHIVRVLIGSVIYAFITCIGVTLLGAGEHDIISLLFSIVSVDSIYRLVIFNLDPTLSILWFIWALLYCYLFLFFVVKVNCLKILEYIIIPLLLVYFILGNIVSGLLMREIPVEYYRNAWFMGIPLFLIGYEIKKREKELMLYVNSNIASTLILVGSIMALLEWRWIQGRQQMYVGSIIAAIGCILFSCWNPEKSISKVIVFVGDKLSLYVYVLHISIGIFIEKFAKILRINQDIGYQCLRPTAVIICTIIISAVVYYAKKNIMTINHKY